MLTEISQPAAPRAGASCQQGQAWKGRREDKKKQQLGSLPRAKDAALPGTHLREARWMPRPRRRWVFARICWIWRSMFSWEVGVGQALRPPSEPVPALPELASASREESLGLPKHTGLMSLRLLHPSQSQERGGFNLFLSWLLHFCQHLLSTAIASGITERGEQFLPRLVACQQISLVGR